MREQQGKVEMQWGGTNRERGKFSGEGTTGKGGYAVMRDLQGKEEMQR